LKWKCIITSNTAEYVLYSTWILFTGLLFLKSGMRVIANGVLPKKHIVLCFCF